MSRGLFYTAVVYDRVLPGASQPTGSGDVNTLNLMFIVGMAVLISVLARYLSRRGGGK